MVTFEGCDRRLKGCVSKALRQATHVHDTFLLLANDLTLAPSTDELPAVLGRCLDSQLRNRPRPRGFAGWIRRFRGRGQVLEGSYYSSV